MVKSQSTRALQIIKNDNIEYSLSARQLMMWNFNTKEINEFSRKDAVNALGFPKRTVESIIKKLSNLKRLERLGQGKATRYKLI
ncbi:hypothetical protein [Rickettsia asembonensis]|uniref:hypothetical protein n=1 Tax=Rickettsia asembonensis TaxID=1068590 RepID=UPI001F528C56|nr:hypothetical protein [Rickettsia asembonensis]WCR56947.1 MAG: hypothetical protein PG979_001004 [Rickettsia asembonensis]